MNKITKEKIEELSSVNSDYIEQSEDKTEAKASVAALEWTTRYIYKELDIDEPEKLLEEENFIDIVIGPLKEIMSLFTEILSGGPEIEEETVKKIIETKSEEIKDYAYDKGYLRTYSCYER